MRLTSHREYPLDVDNPANQEKGRQTCGKNICETAISPVLSYTLPFIAVIRRERPTIVEKMMGFSI